MAPGLPRTHLGRTPLTRLLQDHAPEAAPEAGPTLAERLSQWLGWTDAIALSAVLNAGPTRRAGSADRGAAIPPQRLLDRVEHLRADLARAIRTDTLLTPSPPAPAPEPPRARTGRRPPAQPLDNASPAPAAEDPADFAPCRRQLQGHQRAMAEQIASLRADLRAALADRSPELGRLAALDAVMDDALAAREKHVLSLVPALLEQRFHERRRADDPPSGEVTAAAHPSAVSAVAADAASPAAAPVAPQFASPTASPACSSGPSAAPPPWRIASGQDMQAVLLAELDLRLQPVQGLADALAQHIKRQ